MARFVLVEGLHRLEAAKALGEKTVLCFFGRRAKALVPVRLPLAI